MSRCKKNYFFSQRGQTPLGKIHSFESFGTHEGPGIRYVIFLQGCVGRCVYCQNPDTWDLKAGKLLSADDVFKKIEKTLPFIKASKGGVTVSGGEPLLQIDFLIELFKLCKKNKIHTAIDTSGFCAKLPLHLVDLTDLFIIDIKAADPALHKKITSRDLSEPLSLINILEKKKRSYWVRYVLVPGLNDSRQDMEKLKDLLATFKHCEKFEFLPYHTMGKHKWRYMGLKYKIPRLKPATNRDIKGAEILLA